MGERIVSGSIPKLQLVTGRPLKGSQHMQWFDFDCTQAQQKKSTDSRTQGNKKMILLCARWEVIGVYQRKKPMVSFSKVASIVFRVHLVIEEIHLDDPFGLEQYHRALRVVQNLLKLGSCMDM